MKNGIANFKPIILFRSKTIDESKSDYAEFLNYIANLKANDFDFLKEIDAKVIESYSVYEQGKSRTRDVIEFIKREKISFSQIADFIKSNFVEKNCIITNSKINTSKKEKTDEEQEKLLNNLEDKNNYIRAIFTVDRLTEGWDVLNLFDIVRLYQGQNSGGNTKKTPEATTKEKQLIGRGVRYFPFPYKDMQKNKRKFDEDLKNELRVLEELYYYTYDEESRYISHLKDELRKDGYIRDDKIIKTFKINDEFIKNDFYKDTKIIYNEQISNPERKKKNLDDLKKDFSFNYKLKGLEFNEQEFNFDEKEERLRLNLSEKGFQIIDKKLSDFERHIFNKAIHIKAKTESSLFQFINLKEELKIESVEDLLKSEFLGDFVINIIATKYQSFNDVSNKERLNILLNFFNKVFEGLNSNLNPFIGTEFIKAKSFSEFFGEPKCKSIIEDKDSERIESELKNNKWYVLDSFHGTSEEKELLDFIKNTIVNLEKKYKEVYLLRNEEIYKIYDFKKGRGFQPDFILFLKGEKDLHYQVFIEPKGDNLLEYDSWKNDFLKEIAEKYGKVNILEFDSKKYSLIGLPLFNNKERKAFEREYNQIIN